ncbi:MAG: RIP metalloprotease RseP [candidate division Zixibacteria bacterium]|nr:RIP metalloprotease RseP [candidate division Zixibacteria bacterium]
MTTLLATIFVLGILIFFHELGHFLIAKKSGIRVEKFSLGFPPKMIGKKIGDTEYCISWIPLGGYVKMAGEDPDETKIEGKPYEFMSKPVGIRALVVAAGPVMNLILAVLIFWGIIFFKGKYEIHDQSTQVGLVASGGPADEAGIKPGDEIISINGIEVNTFLEMAQIISQQVEKPIEVKWVREGKEYTAQITTFKDKVLNEKGEMQEEGRIGIGVSYTIIKVGFFKSFLEAVNTAIFILVETIKFIVGLITGTTSVKLLGGPLFIAQTAGQTAKTGFVSLLSFMALLSVNLALLNILPIPVLDGGHLLFLSIEKIKGSPLSLKQRATMQQIGLAFLILLIIFVTYNDLLRAIR